MCSGFSNKKKQSGSIEYNDARDLKEAYEAEKAKKFPSPPTNTETTAKRTVKNEAIIKSEEMEVDESETDDDGRPTLRKLE